MIVQYLSNTNDSVTALSVYFAKSFKTKQGLSRAAKQAKPANSGRV
jgi:hypothetical protein